MLAATHSGKFHADDVLAWALIKDSQSQRNTHPHARRVSHSRSRHCF